MKIAVQQPIKSHCKLVPAKRIVTKMYSYSKEMDAKKMFWMAPDTVYFEQASSVSRPVHKS